MLSLSRKTDYALLILTVLAGERRQLHVSLREIASDHHLPYRFAAEVMRPLVRTGLVESKEGAGGGYRLAKDPSAITVRDVVAAEEGGVAMAACLDAEKHFACAQKQTCTARHGMSVVQRTVLQALARHTIADLMREQTQERIPA